jgi:alkanesulfonate monooxygenase SsuD/methylene tetrahydromethanopterin reductase-like flavin-dependent oxidoreductase (luciferase family)
MNFGYGLLTAQVSPESDRSAETAYEETVELAQHAEAQGFDSVWTSEHHFFRDGYNPSVLPLSAGLATATDHVEIGTSIAIAPLYDPVRLAEDAATIDLLSGGRFRLGLANGYLRQEFEGLGVPADERATRLEECVEICRRAWRGERFSFEGDVFEYDDLLVRPTPTDGGLPLYLGGTSPPAIDRAADIADGHIGVLYAGWYPSDTNEDISERMLGEFGENVDRLVDRHGIDGRAFDMLALQSGFIAESDDRAWKLLREPLAYVRRTYAEHSRERDPDDWNPETMASERLDTIRQGALVGEPDTVAAKLKRLDEQVPGELTVIVRMWMPTLSFKENAAAVRLFGEEVIPRFD